MIGLVAAHPNHRDAADLPAELRRTSVPERVQAWVLAELGSSVLTIRRLPGASSTAVHVLRLDDGRRVVLRRYLWPGFLADEPEAPRRELDALGFAAGHGLAVPEVLAADVSGDGVGDDVPALVMSLVPGTARAVPDLCRLAEAAASVHTVDASSFPHAYFPWFRGTTSAPPPASSRPVLWERAMELWHTSMPSYEPCFVHRDFHPGNLHWRHHRLAGILDWASACRGPWGCDVAHCRDELLRLAGAPAADAFLTAYEDITNQHLDPFWELASVLEHSPESWTGERLAYSEPRLAAAVAALSP